MNLTEILLALNLPDGRLILDFASRMFLAAFLGILLAFTRTPDRERLNLIEAHALLSIAGAMFMVIIAGSVVTAVGLMGAASIIRYRYAIENPADASTLILSLGMGMACGVDRVEIAFAATALILVVKQLLKLFPEALPSSIISQREVMILRFQTNDYAKAIERINMILDKHHVEHSLVSFERKIKASHNEVNTQVDIRVYLGPNIGLHELAEEMADDSIQRVSWHVESRW